MEQLREITDSKDSITMMFARVSDLSEVEEIAEEIEEELDEEYGEGYYQATTSQQIAENVKKLGGMMFLTADHGNAEEMLDSKGKKKTSHTTNPVPFIVYNYDCELKQKGGLADVAPSILDVLGIKKPKEMSGRSLIIKK